MKFSFVTTCLFGVVATNFGVRSVYADPNVVKVVPGYNKTATVSITGPAARSLFNQLVHIRPEQAYSYRGVIKHGRNIICAAERSAANQHEFRCVINIDQAGNISSIMNSPGVLQQLMGN